MDSTNKCRRARIMSGLGQDELAYRIPTSVSTVKRVEAGQDPSPDMLKRWAEETGQAWILEMDEPPAIPPVEVLSLDCEMADVLALFPAAKKMLADGKIDEGERDLRDRFTREVREMEHAAQRTACSMEG